MIHDKLEEILRKRANAFRLAAEKRRAQLSRLEDSKLIHQVDKALGDLARKRMKPGSEKIMDAVMKEDQSAIWRLERWMLQREAKSRGLLKKTVDGKWEYEKKRVDRHNRPAEKVATGKVKFDRWARIKDARNEAMATNYYGGDYYHGDVLRDRYERDRLEGYETMTEAQQERAIKAHSAWREKEIQNGIEEGYLARDDKGNVFAIERRPQKIGPAEKLITGKTKGMRFKGTDGPGIG